MTYPPHPYAFDDYQEDAADTVVYAGRGSVDGLIYASLGLTGEAGEIANQVKKIKRDDQGLLSEDRRQKVSDELGDVLWYVSALADELDIDLASIARRNVAKLSARKAKSTLHGDRRIE